MPASQTEAPPRSAAFWDTAVGRVMTELFTNPVLFLRVAVFAAAFLGLAHLIADMRNLEGASDGAVWGTFFQDLFLTVVFSSVLHALRVIVQSLIKQ